MPAATLREIMDAMGNKLDGAYSSLDPPVQVVARLNPNPTGLSIDIYPGDPFSQDETRGFGEDAGELIFTVRARTNTGDFDASQDLLLAMMDEEDDLCIAHALLDDDTLNGTASSVEVEPPSGFVRFQDLTGVHAYLGVQWRVTVVRARS